jgi:hypothetical protein
LLALHSLGAVEEQTTKPIWYDVYIYISAMFMIMAATLQGSLGISPGCEMGLSDILNMGAVH